MTKEVAPERAELIAENRSLRASLAETNNRLQESDKTYQLKLMDLQKRMSKAVEDAATFRGRLEAIESGLAWRAVSRINRTAERFPRVRRILRFLIRLASWTLNGQLSSKFKQYWSSGKSARIQFRASPAQQQAFFSQTSAIPKEVINDVMSFAERQGDFGLILALNFYAGGGAESAALDYARSYALHSGRAVLLLLTDHGPRRPLPELPKNVLAVDILTFTTESGVNNKEDFLFLLLRSLDFDVFHIVNSITAYKLLIRIPEKTFFADKILVASFFALQFDRINKSKIIGYAKDFLPETISKLDCVITDNYRFSVEGPIKLDLTSYANKFQVVYNKSKLDRTVTSDDSAKLLSKRLFLAEKSPRLKVVWAGRLDKEKRVDLLLNIAQLTQDYCDFVVFGSSVIDGDYEAALEAQHNISRSGAYSSPVEWDRETTGNVFLFTSVWEGMPNTLIEAAYLGFPVVASDVGGVSELVNERTGWLIESNASAIEYARALKEIRDNAGEAHARTSQLIKLAHERHNGQAYSKALMRVPGYGRERGQ